MVKKINALGEQCPIPVIKTKNAIKELVNGGIIEISVDNNIAVQNLTKMANQKKIPCKSEKINDTTFIVTLTFAGSAEESFKQEEQPECLPDSLTSNTVVVLSSNKMGEGNDELGTVLIKGFIYALTEVETLPTTILLYNGGVRLSTEGSDSIQDLKSLEAQGVEILSCGTCLNYYNLAEKLSVGSVTNMYVIAEKLSAATKIIKP